ncbi:hypothetical protein GCK32_015069 [Trichostrongylus colubriformis]|uniref:Uncharacterized protein n=1 Tax=Trichostrongylus colubriformis TaxID=6319 RepID=A0AAN8FLD1_TRICO
MRSEWPPRISKLSILLLNAQISFFTTVTERLCSHLCKIWVPQLDEQLFFYRGYNARKKFLEPSWRFAIGSDGNGRLVWLLLSQVIIPIFGAFPAFLMKTVFSLRWEPLSLAIPTAMDRFPAMRRQCIMWVFQGYSSLAESYCGRARDRIGWRESASDEQGNHLFSPCHDFTLYSYSNFRVTTWHAPARTRFNKTLRGLLTTIRDSSSEIYGPVSNDRVLKMNSIKVLLNDTKISMERRLKHSSYFEWSGTGWIGITRMCKEKPGHGDQATPKTRCVPVDVDKTFEETTTTPNVFFCFCRVRVRGWL